MDLEQPCGISGRLFASGNHSSYLGLLLKRELWTAATDASILAC
jgi:hypothetical protein